LAEVPAGRHRAVFDGRRHLLTRPVSPGDTRWVRHVGLAGASCRGREATDTSVSVVDCDDPFPQGLSSWPGQEGRGRRRTKDE
jgi:hypothetical protein